MLERETAEETRAAQARLLQRAAGGDLQAVSELYDEIAAPLFSVAVRILGDAADAEEIIQDVFVQIWEKAGTFDAALGSAFHWILSITRHRCIDRLRSRARRSRLVEEFQSNMVTGQPANVENTSSLDSDDTGVLRAALNNLPEEQRQAIELAFFGGKTHQEIAEVLNQPLGTIKARIRRGMLKLRDTLQDYA